MVAINSTGMDFGNFYGVESFSIKMQDLHHHCILYEELIFIF